jgi:hypothetical protein
MILPFYICKLKKYSQVFLRYHNCIKLSKRRISWGSLVSFDYRCESVVVKEASIIIIIILVPKFKTLCNKCTSVLQFLVRVSSCRSLWVLLCVVV